MSPTDQTKHEKVKSLLESYENSSGLKLEGKIVVLVFGGYWHYYFHNNLIPKLNKVYVVVKNEKNAAFLYVSCDKSEAQYDSFIKSKKIRFPAIEYNDPIREELIRLLVTDPSQPVVASLTAENRRFYSVNAVPRLVSEAQDHAKDFPWQMKPADVAATTCGTLVFCTIM